MGFFEALWSLTKSLVICIVFFSLGAFGKYLFKAAVVVLPTILIANTVYLVETPWINALIWMVISAAVFLPMTFLPRVTCASAFIGSFLGTLLAERRIVEHVIPIFFKNFQSNGWVTVIAWVLPLLCGVCMALEMRPKKDVKFRILKFFDRVIASCLNGAVILLPVRNFTDNRILLAVLCLVAAVGMYVLDVFTFQKFLDYVEEPDPVKPRKERKPIPGLNFVGNVLRFTGKAAITIVGGTAKVVGAVLDVDIPMPDTSFLDQKNDREAWDYILECRESELAEAERIRKETESANKYYDENYS